MPGISGRAPAAGERARLRAERERLHATAAGGDVVAVVAGEVDAAQVVDLYQRFGTELVAALDRAFALAVWDAVRGRLLLARDPFGQQPLFYRAADGGLAFASDQGELEGEEALPPGCTLAWSAGEPPALHSYWRLPRASEPGMESAAEMTAELRRHLEASVRARLPAEGLATVLLGGDLDSAVLAGMVAALGGPPIAVICAEDPEGEAAARALAARLGCEQRELSAGSLDGALCAVGGELLRAPGSNRPGALRGLLSKGEEGVEPPLDPANLTRVAGLAAAAGLRSPYLDRALAEFAVTLPARAGLGRRVPAPLHDLGAELLGTEPPRRRGGPAPWPRG